MQRCCKCGVVLWILPCQITKWGQFKDSKWSLHKIETFWGARDFFPTNFALFFSTKEKNNVCHCSVNKNGWQQLPIFHFNLDHSWLLLLIFILLNMFKNISATISIGSTSQKNQGTKFCKKKYALTCSNEITFINTVHFFIYYTFVIFLRKHFCTENLHLP